jgi:hypothetical protein
MRAGNSKFVAVLISIVCPMCSKNSRSQNQEFRVDIIDISRKEKDKAISLWYVNQFGAIEELSKALNAPIDYESKITDSPASLLSKQKMLIQVAEKEGLDQKLEHWAKFQKKILTELADSMKYRIDFLTIELNSPSQRGLFYLAYQDRIMKEIIIK